MGAIEIITALGVSVLFIMLFAGGCFWIYIAYEKYRFFIKYKILKRKYPESDVKRLLQYHDAKMSAVDIEKMILLSPTNTRTPRQIKEILYIYSEIQKAERRLKK